jgi:hypothetical protein
MMIFRSGAPFIDWLISLIASGGCSRVPRDPHRPVRLCQFVQCAPSVVRSPEAGQCYVRLETDYSHLTGRIDDPPNKFPNQSTRCRMRRGWPRTQGLLCQKGSTPRHSAGRRGPARPDRVVAQAPSATADVARYHPAVVRGEPLAPAAALWAIQVTGLLHSFLLSTCLPTQA